MGNIAIFRINYKSDFILTLNSDAGWLTPFCIKFWTGAPSQAYFVGFDGTTYTHCAPVAGEPTKLLVQFDDHHLPVGELKFQIGYHFTVADFPTTVEDEVLNQERIIIERDGHNEKVMLDFQGETAPDIQFSLPAYANEAQRIANEQTRIAAEQQRIANEDARIQAEETRQYNEQQRIAQETARVNEFATLKSQSQAATRDANDAATLANQKAQLAADKAALANDAATLAIQKAQLAADKAALANDAAQLAADKAALAQQKAEYAQQQGSYAKDQGDYAKSQGNYAKEQGEIVQADHVRAEADHGIAVDDHTRAESDHGIAADDHTQAGNDHTRAESDHGIAADDHTQAGNDHTRAESDHGIAADDHTQAGNDHTRAESDHTRAESDHAAVEVSLGAFDISAYHATGSVLAKYADLTAALGPDGANIPADLRKGGMSVKYVSTSDNKYVRFNLLADEFSTDVEDWEQAASVEKLENGNIVPLYAKTLEDWADQKAIATPDTYTDAVRTTGGDIPVETSAGSKPESIKPVAGSKWTAKLLFNGSYNMLNAAKWGAANSQPYVGGVGGDFVYFLVPELILGTFGTADENNGLLFTDSEGENVQPTSVYFKPLGTTVPQSLTDGTSITPTNVSYDGKTYKDYATSGAGWLIIPKTYYDNDICAHIAWEDWYDKHVSLNEPATNPEAVVGILMLDGLLALVHADKYLRGVSEEVCDHIEFGDTSATAYHMVDELSVAANAWTNAATGESDSQGNALYRHSATVSLIKQGGAACIEGEDGGIPLTVNGTTVSYVDTNATAPASVVFYEVTATSTTKAYTDSVFSGSNINTETGVLPINDCSIEAQVAMDGEANITVKYAKNIVDQVAINATVDVPQIKEQVEEHEERIVELEDTAVRTGSYDASVSVGLADNLRGDAIVSAEFYKRKTGGTQSVGSGIAAIKEVRGKSIAWNQLVGANTTEVATISGRKYLTKINGVTSIITSNGSPVAINDASVDQVFDLTLIGLPNITIAEFEKIFPLAHYDYNAGTIIPFAGQNLVTIGRNQYNHATGNANLVGGQTYQISGTYTGATIDGVAVTLDSNNCFTTTDDCVLVVTGGNNTDTMVAIYNGESVAYEPYVKHTLPLDPSQWRDKQGNLVFPYGGMHGVNGVYDYAKVDNDGYVRKVVRAYKAIDMGTLSVYTNNIKRIRWIDHYFFELTIPDVSRSRKDFISTLFVVSILTSNVQEYMDNLCMIGRGYENKVYFRYDAATSASAFVSAMQGVMLIYPLAEPVEVELATPVYAKYLVDKDGTEEIAPANGAAPYTTPANISVLYAMDARGEIKNLPKNYLSKESAENMLNAMVSAGVIASYTMTWDAANNRYAFVITAPVESNE